MQVIKVNAPRFSDYWGVERPAMRAPGMMFCTTPFRRLMGSRKSALIRTPNDVGFSNPVDVNRIAPIGPRDQQGTIFAFDPSIVLDVVREYDPTVVDPAAPFRHTHVPVDAYVYRLQHELILSLSGASVQNTLCIEEASLELLGRVVRKAYRVHGNRPAKARWPAQKRHRIAVHSAIEFLSLRYAEKLSLSQIAAVTGFSMPYFCRIFRRLTGSTVHAFLTRLRLRFALSELGDAEDMTQLSLAHGFCDSTHFGLAFRREFGVPPTQARDSLLQRVSRRATRRVRTCTRN